jgi:hypothetical protein
MKHHKLRIAWSVAWGIVAVLLVALWVRSYSSVDSMERKTISGLITIRSVSGQLQYSEFSHFSPAVVRDVEEEVSEGGTFARHPVGNLHLHDSAGHLGFGWRRATKYQIDVIVPLWFPTLIAVAVGGLPWSGKVRRFSLRTLLIATTFVALGLGLIVWLSSN